MRRVWEFLKQVAWNSLEDDVMSAASSVAFWTVLSLAPLVLGLVVVGSLLGVEAQEAFVAEVGALGGQEARDAVQLVLANASEQASRGTWAGWLGAGAWLLSATAVFVQLQTSMNRIWGVQADPSREVAVWVRRRLLSVAMVAAVGFVLAVSLVLSTAVAVVIAWLDWWPVVRVAETTVSLVVLSLVFALVYKVVPDVRISWRDVWVGGAMTSLLFTLGKWAIGTYLGQSAVGSAYGAAGSLVVLLLWVYYSSIIFFVGAELTQAWAREHGHGLQPHPWAVPIPGSRMERAVRCAQERAADAGG